MDDTLSNERILEVRKKYFPPTTTLYHKDPPQLVRAQGVYAYDEKGTRYLDASGGVVCISAGHNHPRIKKALMRMLDNDEIQHTSVLYLSRHVIELTEKLMGFAPEGLDKCTFTNSGSEAVEYALMAARHATGETMVVNLRHGYHGGTSGSLAVCGHHMWRFRGQPVASVTSALEPYCYRCPFGKTPDACHLECAKNVETTIQTTTNGRIAAFIAEPVMGVGGFITPPDEYFHEVVKVVHNYGGKYISDEVQTGAGRCGREYFVTKELGIPADGITMAKGLGNGAPIGGVLMTSEIAQAMSGKRHFNTFGGDPYQAVQARVTLEIIEEEKLIDNAREMGALLKDGLSELAKRYDIIGDVRGRGLMVGVELVKDRRTKAYATEETARLLDLCLSEGLLVGRGGLFGNVLRITPPLCIGRDEVLTLCGTLDRSLRRLMRG